MKKYLYLTAYLAAVVGVIMFLSYRLQQSGVTIGQLEKAEQNLKLNLKTSQLQIDMILAINHSMKEQLQTAREKDNEIDKHFNARELRAHELENHDAGQAVKEWRNYPVPGPVRELYESAGCDNAADCYK